jgi:hypothetical protein
MQRQPGENQLRYLCSLLGHPASGLGVARSTDSFLCLTSNFCKDFASKQTLTDFSSFGSSPSDTRDCAKEFLRCKSYLFQGSIEASTNSWPLYPEDKARSATSGVPLN